MHQSKGLEWKHVLIIMNSSYKAHNNIEDYRLLYVALTRAKKSIHFFRYNDYSKVYLDYKGYRYTPDASSFVSILRDRFDHDC